MIFRDLPHFTWLKKRVIHTDKTFKEFIIKSCLRVVYRHRNKSKFEIKIKKLHNCRKNIKQIMWSTLNYLMF